MNILISQHLNTGNNHTSIFTRGTKKSSRSCKQMEIMQHQKAQKQNLIAQVQWLQFHLKETGKQDWKRPLLAALENDCFSEKQRTPF